MDRLEEFHMISSTPVVDIQAARHLAFGGIPDEFALRSVYWKLLLGYLPADRDCWQKHLSSQRERYQEYLNDLILDSQHLAEQEAEFDDPLSDKSDSNWSQFFKDKELLEEIDKDTRRTYPDMHFFCAGAEDPTHESTISEDVQGTHQLALKRALFVYAKLNPGVRYVQGMNELFAPIYYVYANDATGDFSDNAEADAFWSFNMLMADFRDHFCSTLDSSDMGISGSLTHMISIVKKNDPSVASRIEQLGIHPQLYGLRWISLLLSQEFQLPDVMRLWDSLFAMDDRLEFLLLLCAAMLVYVRHEILSGDFGQVMKMLQNFPPVDVAEIINLAVQLRDGEYQPPINQAETQKKKTFKSLRERVKRRSQS